MDDSSAHEAVRSGGAGAVMAETVSHRLRLASPAAALALGSLVLVLLVASWPLSAIAHQLNVSNDGPDILILAGTAVGMVIAWHQPGNPVGWILLAAMGCIALSNDASSYSVADYRLHHGALPLGWVAVLLQLTWALTIVLLGLVILLFPDGRPPSPAWRWVLRVYLAVASVWLAGALGVAAIAIIGHNIRVDASGNLLTIDSGGLAGWWNAIKLVFFLVLGICWLASLAGQAVGWQRSSDERRQQLKWLLFGSAVCLVGLALALAFGSASGILGLLSLLGFAGIFALPASIGVAVLKYRLYDIDRIISRTLAYAIVTGLLIGLYAGLVLMATRVLSFHTPIAVAAATLVAAALFNPLRRRVQLRVDRRFNRARYDADHTVAAFATRLKDAVDLDSVRDDLAGVVYQALEPAHVSVWINERG
jgi:hypothetical protein